MKFLFDSSSIFRAIKENKVDLLIGNFTLELARYELGNIVWKDCFLQAKFSKEEASAILETIKHALSLIEMMPVAGNEDKVLELAIQLKITFYDASYVYLARLKESQLITEDVRLIKKAVPTVRASTLNDICK
jgi:predicted nucleic acid-binding protein